MQELPQGSFPEAVSIHCRLVAVNRLQSKFIMKGESARETSSPWARESVGGRAIGNASSGRKDVGPLERTHARTEPDTLQPPRLADHSVSPLLSSVRSQTGTARTYERDRQP